jgi:hypothetical protein
MRQTFSPSQLHVVACNICLFRSVEFFVEGEDVGRQKMRGNLSTDHVFNYSFLVIQLKDHSVKDQQQPVIKHQSAKHISFNRALENMKIKNTVSPLVL